MIANDITQRKLHELPEPVLDYLYSERAGELNVKIIDRNGLNESQEPELFALLNETFAQELPLDRLLSEAKARFGFDDLKAKALAADIAGYRLLPLDKWIGDVSAFLRSLGADPKAYPDFRVPIAHRTIDQAADEVVTSVGSADPHLQNRLRNVVESLLAGVRTDKQAEEVLTRPEKIGGAGLDPKTAAHVIEEAREETRSIVLDREVSVPKETAPVAEAPVKKTADAGSLAITPEDAAELARFKKAPPTKDIEAAVQEIYLASGLQTADEAMAKRVKTVIANRLRDVRDQMETLEIMTQPKELGGLNLGQDAARALLETIQARLRGADATHEAKVKTEKAEWVAATRAEKTQTEAQVVVDEKTELEQLYQSIVSKSKKASAKAPAPVVTSPTPVASGKASAAPANLPIAVANPVPPEFRPAPPPPPAPVVAIAPPAPPAPPPLSLVKPVRETAPAPRSAPAPLAPRPKLEDVKASPKLTGPVEELRAITVVDFRRLSKDPKEACLKIKDKIDLLGEQSYTRKSEGIAAWGASEVVQTYLDLMRESLNGTPLKDAVLAREAQKKPILTQEEFQAVAELSRQLRY